MPSHTNNNFMPPAAWPTNRGRNTERQAEQRETCSMSRARGGSAHGDGTGGDAENRNPNIIVRSSGLDSYVPTIRRVNESNVKSPVPAPAPPSH